MLGALACWTAVSSGVRVATNLQQRPAKLRLVTAAALAEHDGTVAGRPVWLAICGEVRLARRTRLRRSGGVMRGRARRCLT